MHTRIWTWILALVFIRLILSDDVAQQNTVDPSLLWGPYRPNLYFGIRPRIPQSLLMGLMWAKTPDNSLAEKDLRHVCEQNEGMTSYRWGTYDPRTGGSYSAHDITNFIDMTMDFFKPSDEDTGSQWGLRISGNPRPNAPDDLEWLVVLYIGSEERNPGEDSFLSCTKSNDTEVDCYGNQPQIQNFTLQVRDIAMNGFRPQEGHPFSTRSDTVPPEGVWQARSIYMFHVHSGDEQTDEDGSLHFIQKGFKGPFQLEILFSSNFTESLITSTHLTSGLNESKLAFSKLFDSVYALKPPFDDTGYTSFLQSLLSGLLGGIGYFYGDSMVDRARLSEYEEKDINFWEKVAQMRAKAEPDVLEPGELLTMIPSRPAFPHGFLWDEGFHLSVVLEWDLDLAMDIVRSWLGRMDDDGWIAREQFLGSEARSAVPPKYRVQYPQHANPPTMFMVVSAFVDTVAGNKTYAGHSSKYLNQPHLAKELLRSIYPLLYRHYVWFRNSQAGDLLSYARPDHSPSEAYRWRGRTPGYAVTSGLDDYPRAEPPHPGEFHLDALSWVGSMARIMTQLSELLVALHWSNEHQVYCDATIENGTHTLVCHKGYLSLFPFLVGLMEPQHEHMKAVLGLIKNETELWSPFGIRSLSKQDEYYRTGDDYWRGSIWVNINFMILERLLETATIKGPHQRQARNLYISLRHNIVTTVYNSWHSTGQAWEHYNPDTGQGGGVQHFTGWTALVVKIAAMPDLSSRGGYTFSDLGDRLSLNSYTVVSTAILVIFVFMFRRNLARMWTSMWNR